MLTVIVMILEGRYCICGDFPYHICAVMLDMLGIILTSCVIMEVLT